MEKYYEVKINCTKDVSESICSFLLEHGALGAIEDVLFIKNTKKDKKSVWIRGYFNNEDDFLLIKSELKRFLGKLKKNFKDFDGYRVLSKWLRAKNWCESHKKYFKPIKVSNRIVVKPDYEKYQVKPGERVILINPKMAFGIGSHPTTKMCIKFLDELLVQADGVTRSGLLDAGTGSGIIAISAAKLGMKDIYGFDIDRIAYETALENVKKNGVESHVRLGCHGIETVTGTYDIVIANILANVLISLKEYLVRATKAEGHLILSGILKTERALIEKEFSKGLKLKLISVKKEKEWVALDYEKVTN